MAGPLVDNPEIYYVMHGVASEAVHNLSAKAMILDVKASIAQKKPRYRGACRMVHKTPIDYDVARRRSHSSYMHPNASIMVISGLSMHGLSYVEGDFIHLTCAIRGASLSEASIRMHTLIRLSKSSPHLSVAMHNPAYREFGLSRPEMMIFDGFGEIADQRMLKAFKLGFIYDSLYRGVSIQEEENPSRGYGFFDGILSTNRKTGMPDDAEIVGDVDSGKVALIRTTSRLKRRVVLKKSTT